MNDETGIIKTQQEICADTARKWIAENALVIDCETTGLADDAQMCEIAIIDCAGRLQYQSLVKPTVPIPPDATRIHGITDEMVKEAPTWKDIAEEVLSLFRGRTVLSYNFDYDQRILLQSSKAHELVLSSSACGSGCVMELYMNFTGRNRWCKLDAACREIGCVANGVAHRALFDALAAREVLKNIASYKTGE